MCSMYSFNRSVSVASVSAKLNLTTYSPCLYRYGFLICLMNSLFFSVLSKSLSILISRISARAFMSASRMSISFIFSRPPCMAASGIPTAVSAACLSFPDSIRISLFFPKAFRSLQIVCTSIFPPCLSVFPACLQCCSPVRV